MSPKSLGIKMRNKTKAYSVAMAAILALVVQTNEAGKGEDTMTANGTFEVKLTPQEDEGFPAGRMLIDKTFSGDLSGTGLGQMISKRTESGVAVYHAVEEFSGELKGKQGGFTLIHSGYMDSEAQSLEVTILDGSGSGELAGISGAMLITQDDSGHQYELHYEL